MPLFFNLADPLGDDHSVRWYQPTLFYLTALVLKLLPLTESSVRLPAALIGILDVLLMYLVALRLFRSRLHAVAASLMLVLTPAHLIFSRQATDYICSLPFVLGWLWCLIASLETGSLWLSFAAGLLLGVGVYSYIAAWLWMPFFMFLTWAVQYRAGRQWARSAIVAAFGFTLPVLPLVLWLWSHPEMLSATFGRYQASNAVHLTLLQSARSVLRFNNVQDKLSVYWDYFNPSFLFLTGGTSLTTATGRTGVFLLSLAVLLPLGIYDLLKRRRSETIGVVLLAGLAFAPVPATAIGERYMVQRELIVLPFAILISTYGLALLFRQRTRSIRLIAVSLVAAMPLQFAFFARDYFTHYQFRSAYYFDPSNFREIAEYVIAADAADPAPGVYLSRQLDDASARWRFYVTKHGREGLLPRTRYFDGDGLDLGPIASGSLVVFYENGPKLADLLAIGKWSVERTIVEPSGGATSVILKKLGS